MAAKTKITRDELKEMKSLTMACWWPSQIFGRTMPDWDNIEGELAALLGGAERRFEIGASELKELHQLRSLRQLARDRAKGR